MDSAPLARVLLLGGEIPVRVMPDGTFQLIEPKKRKAAKPRQPAAAQPWEAKRAA